MPVHTRTIGRLKNTDKLDCCQTVQELCVVIVVVFDFVVDVFAFFLQQDESRILRVRVIAGIGLAKKDILGAR